MKSILGFVAVCFTAAVLGCQTTSTVSPGAISECGAKNGQACTKDKSECCGAKHCDGTSMGAVSETAGCASKCADKADCASKCASGCTKTDANLGAVSDKAGCASKSDCSKAGCSKNADANLGAMSEKAGCSAKRSCGAAKAGCGSN